MDDAVKVMDLETSDGRGLLAYAGLGATSQGTQPSEWMSAVLRGHGGLTFEQALGVLANVANKQLPKHLVRMPGGGAHFIVVPAFIRGVGARLYSIDNVLDPKAKRHWYRFTSHLRTDLPGSLSPRIALAGTGGMYLARKSDTWCRELLRYVKARDRGKVSDDLIADYLAQLNYEAHQNVQDGTVGLRCIVVWRRRHEALQTDTGGGHRFYTAVDREREAPAIPAISNGLDTQAIVGALLGNFQRTIPDDAWPPFDLSDTNEIDRLMGELPSSPDNRLR